MTDYTCPVDGCDYGENGEKRKASVKAHINAKGDPQHVWDDLRDAVEAQGETSDDGGDDDPDDPPAGMAIEDEYQKQYQQTPDPDDADDGPDPDDDDAAVGSSIGTAFVIATVGLLVAVLLRSKDDEPQPDDEPTTDAGSMAGWDE